MCKAEVVTSPGAFSSWQERLPQVFFLVVPANLVQFWFELKNSLENSPSALPLDMLNVKGEKTVEEYKGKVILPLLYSLTYASCIMCACL